MPRRQEGTSRRQPQKQELCLVFSGGRVRGGHPGGARGHACGQSAHLCRAGRCPLVQSLGQGRVRLAQLLTRQAQAALTSRGLVGRRPRAVTIARVSAPGRGLRMASVLGGFPRRGCPCGRALLLGDGRVGGTLASPAPQTPGPGRVPHSQPGAGRWHVRPWLSDSLSGPQLLTCEQVSHTCSAPERCRAFCGQRGWVTASGTVSDTASVSRPSPCCHRHCRCCHRSGAPWCLARCPTRGRC